MGLDSAVVGAEKAGCGGTVFVDPGPVGHGRAFQRAGVVVVHFAAGSRGHAGSGFRNVQLTGAECTQVGIMKISFQLFNFG